MTDPYSDPTPPQPPVADAPAPPVPAGVQPVYVVKPPTSSLAVTALVMSIIGLVTGLCTFGVPSVVAVILGHAAVRDTKNGSQSGHGMAVGALVMGYIVVVPWGVTGAMALFGWFVSLFQQ